MLINGQEFSYADLTFSFLGNFNVAGVTAIEWKKTAAKQNLMGAGREPVARSRGGSEYTGSATLMTKDFFALVKAAGYLDLTEIPAFTLTVKFANGVDAPTVVSLPFTEFLESGLSGSRGDIEMSVQVPIIFAQPIYS